MFAVKFPCMSLRPGTQIRDNTLCLDISCGDWRLSSTIFEIAASDIVCCGVLTPRLSSADFTASAKKLLKVSSLLRKATRQTSFHDEIFQCTKLVFQCDLCWYSFLIAQNQPLFYSIKEEICYDPLEWFLNEGRSAVCGIPALAMNTTDIFLRAVVM